MVPNQEVKDVEDNQWFLQHFSVIHERETTKVRITFDAVAKTDGVAFNECMHAGPALQNNLVNLILRFCKDPLAIVADISDMFLQVEMEGTIVSITGSYGLRAVNLSCLNSSNCALASKRHPI